MAEELIEEVLNLGGAQWSRGQFAGRAIAKVKQR
jgi:hypothetical protein